MTSNSDNLQYVEEKGPLYCRPSQIVETNHITELKVNFSDLELQYPSRQTRAITEAQLPTTSSNFEMADLGPFAPWAMFFFVAYK